MNNVPEAIGKLVCFIVSHLISDRKFLSLNTYLNYNNIYNNINNNSQQSSCGENTPRSVIIPVISSAGVTSNAGFQHDIPTINNTYIIYFIKLV